MANTYSCPVCDGPLPEPAWTDVGPSDDICPSCGIQFGYNDVRRDLRDRIHSAWRKLWLSNGKRPLDPWPSLDELMAALKDP